jgi:hypothetical protein
MNTHTAERKERRWKTRGSNQGGFVWFLGFIGAFVYYIQQAESFGEGVIGFFKALVWPAILVYKLLG